MGIFKFFAFKIVPIIGIGLFVSMRLGKYFDSNLVNYLLLREILAEHSE